MKITIETEDGSNTAVSSVPATTMASTDTTSEAPMDGGGAPTMPGVAAEGDQGSDAGGPPQALLDTIAAAEAYSQTEVVTPATEDIVDGGGGPSAV